ncbi:P-loop containing nucleoside triphosphate hydrolase protein [Mucor mucedo]|uniref:P-loop containing nucleoside triphosphate hydrolase protein n=1 Tax=Mucor mucedo TaxID=29922 RepID=UPI00221F9CD8|nr:P-loop containing nucleoside triphosphate hydrolase protein [Mucor mucedo]KAI7889822.1 P-loop containing nucleoside triphosphate hydrolase protein [Mucor mucedo]
MKGWLEQVSSEIGGCHELLLHIVQKIKVVQTTTSLSALPRSKGMLLYGKPGTGKTVLAIAVAKYSNLPYYVLNSPDIFQTEEGVSESKLTDFFQQSNQHPMSILVLDEFDMIAAKLTSKKGSLDMRISSILMALLDRSKNVFVIGLSSRIHAVDPSFLRSGRLDDIQEIVIKLPEQRYDILRIITKNLPFQSDKERDDILMHVSKITHGFVPSDLQSLSSQVILSLIKQQETHVKKSHFIQALTIVKPSNLNEFASKIPDISFSDIYGMDDIIAEIKTSVIQPFQHPENYLELGISPPKGILIHGPTGVGKTMLCSALAAEAGVNFMLVESSQIRSKVIGESEKGIAKLFSQARANSPCILFIDQIDMLLPKRGTSQSSENTSDRIVTGFLTEMDGLLTKSAKKSAQIDLLVVAATNRIDAIDPAVLRPGRFDEHVYIPLPDEKQREEIVRGISAKMPISLNDFERGVLVKNTKNWSGAQLDNLFREAAMVSLRENVHNTKVNCCNGFFYILSID